MILTEADKRILPLGTREAGGFHWLTEWYLAGWVPTSYQYAWHQIVIPNTTTVSGIATGKTSIVTASYITDCLTIPYFRALNTSVTAKQAQIAFEMANTWIEISPNLEHLVEKIELRPFPIITFKNFSEFHFRTAGSDGRFIRGFEYDRANLDEAGLDLKGEIIKVLRGRLRGKRPDGSKRMARLDVTTSPTAALWLLEHYQRGDRTHHNYNPKFYASFRWATWDNPHLADEQIEAMKVLYPSDMIDVELGGMFPDFGLSMFPVSHLAACTNQSLYDAAYISVFPEDGGKAQPGWRLEEDPRHGITLYEAPFVPGRKYVVSLDPGQGSYPNRDAGVVCAADVTNPEDKQLVYFHWINGKGSYAPCLNSFKYAINKYRPLLKGVDVTGAQKGIDEIAFKAVGIDTDGINFSTDKWAVLNTHVHEITSHHWSFPQIAGLVRQHSVYTPEADRAGGAQDTVMAMAELSWLDNFVPHDRSENNIATAKNNYRTRNQRAAIGGRHR